MHKRFDPIRSRILPVFIYYTGPAVIGMLAMSCAVIIDGFFLGQHAGSEALAAVNLTIPVSATLVGVAMMLSVGGAARTGKYIGAGRFRAAGRCFSQTLVLMLLVSVILSVSGILLMDRLVLLLGASEALSPAVGEYLTVLLVFNSFQMGMFGLFYFIRVDGYPLLASTAMVVGGMFNILLDWIFVIKMDLGPQGAALGSGLSEVVAFLIMGVPFVMGRTRLKFQWRKQDWSEAFKAAYNGFSELSNEVSIGIVTLLFNLIIMKRLGENGIAAFAVINYIMICVLTINSGVSDSVQSVISTNFGASRRRRITAFLSISTGSVLAVGIGISLLLILSPGTLIDFFVRSRDHETIRIAHHFIARIWPIFLLNGVNIVLSSYLTAMNRALPSTVVSLARNLLLPAVLLLIIPILTGYDGILIVLPLSELVTVFIALYLLNKNSPKKLIGASR